MTWRRLGGVALAALCLAVSGCEEAPVAGKLCKGGEPDLCDGRDKMWSCVTSHWLSVPCRGAQGCTGTPAQCDTSLGRAGEVCLEQRQDEVCSEDGREVLACEDGALVPARPCHGPKKCAATPGSRPECDGTIGVLAEPCKLEEARSFACSVDGKAVLECDSPPTGARLHGTSNRVYDLSRECPTPAGCKQGGNWAYCDFTGAAVGTPCGKGNENRLFCSPNRDAVLRCNATTLRLETDRPCKKEPCKPDGADGATNGGCRL